MTHRMAGIFFVSLAMAAARPATAQSAAKAAAPAEAQAVTTTGSVVIDGATIAYNATAGTLILHDAQQQPIASVFYVAYERSGVPDRSRRPITFAYNGGPGSASAWLHLGGIGPRRVLVPSAGHAEPPPYSVVPNPYSILDSTDLVFIDAVGTGYSHPLGAATGAQFWGVDEDVRTMGQFIHDYLAAFHRWNSPKFLLGESYGTFRTADLVNYLQGTLDIECNGVILLSSVLNFEASSFTAGNDLPYILFLPSYAAIAWYHHALTPAPASLDALLSQVETFAFQTYAPALLEGQRLAPEEKQRLADELAHFTGLPQGYWMAGNLRVHAEEFEQELLAPQGLVLGRLDARYTNFNLDPLVSLREYPVMASATRGAFTAAINDYLDGELHYPAPGDYVLANSQAASHWDWRHTPPGHDFGARPGFTDVVPDLRMAMVTNPHLQLMVNEGYYDLGTPFFATEYTIAQLDLPAPLAANVHIHHYQTGHMLYLEDATAAELHQNLEAYYKATLDGTAPAAGSH